MVSLMEILSSLSFFCIYFQIDLKKACMFDYYFDRQWMIKYIVFIIGIGAWTWYPISISFWSLLAYIINIFRSRLVMMNTIRSVQRYKANKQTSCSIYNLIIIFIDCFKCLGNEVCCRAAIIYPVNFSKLHWFHSKSIFLNSITIVMCITTFFSYVRFR